MQKQSKKKEGGEGGEEIKEGLPCSLSTAKPLLKKNHLMAINKRAVFFLKKANLRTCAVNGC